MAPNSEIDQLIEEAMVTVDKTPEMKNIKRPRKLVDLCPTIWASDLAALYRSDYIEKMPVADDMRAEQILSTLRAIRCISWISDYRNRR
ncbi:MAG: hypothetical protein ACLTK0_10765 [Anaerovoracaceae bacterium]